MASTEIEIIEDLTTSIETFKHVTINYKGEDVKYWVVISEFKRTGSKMISEYRKLTNIDIKRSDKKKIRKFLEVELTK